MPLPDAEPTPPPCPATGLPARRLVQWVGARLLADLWRHTFKVDVRPSFRGTTRFGLWESPTGLFFFDPPRAGDAGFYDGFHARLGKGIQPNAKRPRGEFAMAAALIRPGERVLDVGCGPGAFRAALPHADYVGLDPHLPPGQDSSWARRETLQEHLVAHAGAYDVVCAFQVLEHVEDPLTLLQDMVRATRPGGRVMVVVPHVPSAHSRIPNWLINVVPHHLTWWTAGALQAISARAGLEEPQVSTVPWAKVDGLVYWMARCSPVKCTDRFYAGKWSWHAAAAFSFFAGWLMWQIRPLPPAGSDEGASLLLVARKPD